jgi:hypothetical protein
MHVGMHGLEEFSPLFLFFPSLLTDPHFKEIGMRRFAAAGIGSKVFP